MSGNQAMSDFVFASTYARYDDVLSRRETFEEAVDRMCNMHLSKYGHLGDDVKDLIINSFSSVKRKEVLASQRALQFGGHPVLSHNMRIYNCATSYCDRVRFFAEALYMGLCGVGVGFSVQRLHTDSLPPLISKDTWARKISLDHVVEDSIEGWADALDVLMEGYLTSAPIPDFDFDEIRAKGEPISAGGTAPGSEPLEIALEKIESLLVELVQNDVRHLEPIHCFDIVMYASEAVISGGRRRAATIALFDKDDKAMLSAKTGNWYEENMQRSLANISAVHIIGDDDKQCFDELIESAKQFGEPGVIFSRSPYYLYNPCVEIGMCPVLIKDERGEIVSDYELDMLNDRVTFLNKGYSYESGWQTCNLTEINGGAVNTPADLNRAARNASIIGTLQAGYTASGYLKPVSEEIIKRESLLGVSITGIMERPDILLDTSVLSSAANIAVKTNAAVSSMIGIPPASRVTCVKPAGTTSIILGTSSGVHPHFGRRVIRHIQVNKDNPVLQMFEQINPTLCEESQWSSSGTDTVVAFPLQFPDTSVFKSDLTATEFLEKVSSVQQSWVASGCARPESCEGLTHNVSNTVSVGEDEWEDVSRYLWSKRDQLTGVAMLGDIGESCYPQLPNQAILDVKDMELRYGDKATSLALKGDYEAAEKNLKSGETLDTLVHHVLGLQKWENLARDIKSVPYDMMYEEEDTTSPSQDSACSGQSCEVKYL